ncbi:MAG: HEAT repeat domain-containing protein [Ktedonobacteraceae bacterium]|nr:HEAT repeat domain-containing protein [Ktedonobacteraceae bacterium]
MKHVFISYKHEDFDFAESVKLRLEEVGFKTWKDDHIHAGEEWRNSIDQAIKNAFAMVVIMTPEAKASEYITYEWSFAVGMGVRIIPLKYKATPLHPRLEVFQYLDFTSNNNDLRPWKRLIAEITEAAQVARSSPTAGVLSFIQQARAGLNGTDANVRKEAIATLAQANTTEAQEMLLEALMHPVADVRQQAAVALGNIHYQAAVPRLIELFHSETTPAVRVATIDALEALNDARAVSAFLVMLPRASTEEKIRMVRAFGSFRDASVVPTLFMLYSQGNAELREAIILTLSCLDGDAAVPLLGKALQDVEQTLCVSAARALLRVGSDDAVSMLVDAVCVMNKSHCEGLLREIASCQLDKLVLELENAYQKHVSVHATGANREKNAQVRRRIIHVLGILKSKKAVPTLLQAMDDEDTIVQRETVVAFKNICDERVLPALITILRWRFEDYDEKTLVCAVQAVGQIGNVSSVPHLKAVLEVMLDRHTELAVQIIRVIGSIGAYETIEYLKKVKFRLKRDEHYVPDKGQELIDEVEQAIEKVRSRVVYAS